MLTRNMGEKELDLLSSISSGPRLEILQMLRPAELKSSQIAKNMQTSIQAITRHLDRLSESKLIEKTVTGTYRLTPIADVLMLQIPLFEFLENNKEFFSTHDFSGIPPHLVSRLGDLTNCEYEGDVMKSMQRARDVCANAKKSLVGATFTVPLELYDVVLENLKQGGYSKLVYGKNTIVSKGFSEYGPRKEYLKYAESGQVEEKIVENIPISVAVSENECHMLFANKGLRIPDCKGVFFGKDPRAIAWCSDLVDYYWRMPAIEGYALKEQ
ncbi:winged helix-turn-helix domain-containing protein [Nitrosopumilus sp. K4]|uniref:helix-turn-helix transcriptional regulator n=1 Tax=Nitrosopumilus sp. K4 TaxID=2795383 RepID=UPI0020124420|nr:helix-turn-helix domain-containing protein [Nitrosopumilus sp. K4]